jgi:Cdc6-like AAA superfamily ATPase
MSNVGNVSIPKLDLHNNIVHRLELFYQNNCIPHIIFYGASGSGKRTIVYNFINRIYENDKQKIKSNVMYVNCAHGKGIKFIREELKFFAKSNIHFNNGIKFKTIVLLNADNLTIDAQSALRRCIELFSYNTRFFIIVENKNKLLNPILSRFCEIYIPEYMIGHKIVNLHRYYLQHSMPFLEVVYNTKYSELNKIIEPYLERIQPLININMTQNNGDPIHSVFIELSDKLYEYGYSCIDLLEWMNKYSKYDKYIISKCHLCFNEIKSEYRCEKLLMIYMLDFLFLRSNSDSNNMDIW